MAVEKEKMAAKWLWVCGLTLLIGLESWILGMMVVLWCSTVHSGGYSGLVKIMVNLGFEMRWLWVYTGSCCLGAG